MTGKGKVHTVKDIIKLHGLRCLSDTPVLSVMTSFCSLRNPGGQKGGVGVSGVLRGCLSVPLKGVCCEVVGSSCRVAGIFA